MVQKFWLDTGASKIVVDSFFNAVEAVEKQFSEWLDKNKNSFKGDYNLIDNNQDIIIDDFCESLNIKGVFDYLPVDEYKAEIIKYYKVIIRASLKTYQRAVFSESANINCKTKIIFEE